MPNQATRHAQATLLDTMIESHLGSASVAYSYSTFTGSYSNPLQTFQLLSIDLDTGMSVEDSALAKLTGLPARAFTDEVLTGVSQDQLLTALGKCALVWLECIRAQIHQELIEEQNQAENLSENTLSIWSEVKRGGQPG
jgi:hypothetical protein